MSHDRIIILAIDALEYELVERWDLETFKQKTYGKINVPILEKDEEPATPVVWASFITGKSPDVTGVTRFKDWDNRTLPFLDRTATRMGVGIRNRKKMGDFLSKMGFKKIPPSKERYKKIGTIFSDVPNSKAISIPAYNEDNRLFKIRREMIHALENEEEKKQLLKKIYDLDVEKVNELMASLPGYRLVMVHLFTLDVVQHLYFKKPEIIHYHYGKIADLTSSVKEKLNENDVLIIVSDHGQRKGIHTDYGFYSANINLAVSSIYEFREAINKLLK